MATDKDTRLAMPDEWHIPTLEEERAAGVQLPWQTRLADRIFRDQRKEDGALRPTTAAMIFFVIIVIWAPGVLEQVFLILERLISAIPQPPAG